MTRRSFGIPDVPPTDPTMREFLNQLKLAISRLDDRITAFIGDSDLTGGTTDPNNPVDDLPPGAPENLLGVCTSGVVHLSWDNTGDDDLVMVEIWENSSGTFPRPITNPEEQLATVPAQPNTPGSYSRAGLDVGAVRYYWVRSVDSAGNKSEFNDDTGVSVTVTDSGSSDPDDDPAAPGSLTAIPGLNSIWLQCVAPTDTDLARIDFYENTTNNSATSTRVGSSEASPGQQVSWRRSGLASGVTRYYWAKAVDVNANESGFSNVASATTGSTNPEDLGTLTGLNAPTGQNVTSALTTDTDGTQIVTVTVSWNEVADDRKAFYEVSISEAGGSAIVVPAYTTRYSFRAQGNVVYDIKVRVVDIFGHRSNWTVITSHTSTRKTAAPGAPASLSVTAGIKTNWLSWTNTTGADIAKVEVWSNITGTTPTAGDAATMRIATVNALASGKGGFSHTGLTTGVQYFYWLRTLDTSGNASTFTSASFGIPVQANTADIAANAITATQILANTITGDRINTSTSLPGTITVGTTGVSIGTVESRASDPAARINANTTQIDPGKITISGATTLASWRDGTDTTKISGGSISTNSIAANKLQIGNRGVEIQDIVFEHNTMTQGSGVATANWCAWSAGKIRYTKDDGTLSSYINIPAGSTDWTGITTVFIYWVKDATTLSTTTSAITAYQSDRIILAQYDGGVKLLAHYGGTIVDGSRITTGSIQANQIAASTITGDKIAGGTITGDLIQGGTIVAENIFVGTLTAEQIEGGGLSDFTGAEDAGSIALTTSQQEICSYDLDTYDDDRLEITVTAYGVNSGSALTLSLYLYADGSMIASWGDILPAPHGYTKQYAKTYMPPANTEVTFSLKASLSVSGSVSNDLASIEVKRWRR